MSNDAVEDVEPLSDDQAMELALEGFRRFSLAEVAELLERADLSTPSEPTTMAVQRMCCGFACPDRSVLIRAPLTGVRCTEHVVRYLRVVHWQATSVALVVAPDLVRHLEEWSDPALAAVPPEDAEFLLMLLSDCVCTLDRVRWLRAFVRIAPLAFESGRPSSREAYVFAVLNAWQAISMLSDGNTELTPALLALLLPCGHPSVRKWTLAQLGGTRSPNPAPQPEIDFDFP